MEKLVLYQVEKEEAEKIRRIAVRLRLQTERIGKAQAGLTLKELATGRGAFAVEDADAMQSLLLICNLPEKRLDKLLFELRRENVRVTYKAILTKNNENWTVGKLLAELSREKAAYENR